MPRKNRQKAIASVEYEGNAIAGTMTVKFSDGSTYDYEGVPITVFVEFEASGPSGSFFNANIRGVYD